MRLDKMIVTGILDIVTVPLEKNQTVEIVHRKTYGLTLCKSGKVSYMHNGVSYVSEPYTVLLLPRDGCYTLTCEKAGYFPVINFMATDFLTDKLISFSVASNERYLDLFDEMRRLQDLPDSRLEQMGQLYYLFSRLQKEGYERKNRAIEVADYIQRNFHDPELSNKSIAQANHISEVYLRKLFAREFDSSPRQYLLQVRIANAKRMLEQQDVTISHVAERCGYSTVYHFCRSFKGITGNTPSEYRSKSRQWYL